MTFGLLYVSQGLPVGFMTITFYAWLAELGLSPQSIGLAGLVAASPWTFKLLWGPLIDRFTGSRWGRRRPYVIAAQAGLIAGALALTTITDPAQSLQLLTGILFVQALFASVQDVAVDAMAIDVVPASELGRTNAVMLVGKICGVAFGAGGLATILDKTGLSGVAWTQVAVLGSLALVPILIREGTLDRPSEAPGVERAPFWRPLGRSLFAGPSVVVMLVVVGVATSHSCALTTFEVHAVQDLGYRQANLSRIISILGGAGALAGAATAALSPRAMLFKLLGSAAILMGLVSIGFALAARWWPLSTTVWIYAFADGAAIGVLLTGFHAVGMGLCDARVAATQFSVYMAVFNGSTALGRGLVGPAISWLGPVTPFFFVAAMALMAVVLLRFIRIDRITVSEPHAVQPS